MTACAHTVAGVFPSAVAAANSVLHLEQVGFEPWRIEVVGDPRRALEIGTHRRGREGLFVGFIAGVAFVVIGALVLHVALLSLEGIVVAIAVTLGWSLIGFLAGYGMKRRGPDADILESTMRDGGAVVAVRCTKDCEVAEHAFAEAGASEVLDKTACAL